MRMVIRRLNMFRMMAIMLSLKVILFGLTILVFILLILVRFLLWYDMTIKKEGLFGGR